MNERNEELQNKKESLNKRDDFYKYLFIIAFLFAITTLLNPFINYETLDEHVFLNNLIVLIISISLAITTIALWGISILHSKVKRKRLGYTESNGSIRKHDDKKEIRGNILGISKWLFYGFTIISLIVQIIFLLISIFNS